MILVDTNVLVGLVDERDRLHPIALSDARRLTKQPWATTDAVLAEAIHLLLEPHVRARLRDLLMRADVSVLDQTTSPVVRSLVFDWMIRYAQHTPDWADACLVVASSLLPKAKVWTYDSEFATIWRRPDGSRVPLAVR